MFLSTTSTTSAAEGSVELRRSGLGVLRGFEGGGASTGVAQLLNGGSHIREPALGVIGQLWTALAHVRICRNNFVIVRVFGGRPAAFKSIRYSVPELL